MPLPSLRELDSVVSASSTGTRDPSGPDIVPSSITCICSQYGGVPSVEDLISSNLIMRGYSIGRPPGAAKEVVRSPRRSREGSAVVDVSVVEVLVGVYWPEPVVVVGSESCWLT